MNRRRAAVVVVGTVAVLVGLNALAVLLDEAVGGHTPGGPEGSSYATQAGGLAAYAELLARYDHPVRRLRGPVAEAALDPGETLVVDGAATSTPEDLDAMADLVARGGHLVLLRAPETTIATVTGASVRLGPGHTRYRTIHESYEPITVVGASGDGAYVTAPGDGGGIVPLVSEDGVVLALDVPRGSGGTVLVADASPLTNAGLAEADNAAFGVALAGGDGRPVAFAEGGFGYGEDTGLAALPPRWKATLLTLAVATIVYGWARAKRLGPPDRPERELPPARAAYVQALARTLARTHQPNDALDGLAASARADVARRARLPADAAEGDIRQAAMRLGLSAEETDALFRAPRTEHDVLALGRAVTHVSRAGSEA